MTDKYHIRDSIALCSVIVAAISVIVSGYSSYHTIEEHKAMVKKQTGIFEANTAYTTFLDTLISPPQQGQDDFFKEPNPLIPLVLYGSRDVIATIAELKKIIKQENNDTPLSQKRKDQLILILSKIRHHIFEKDDVSEKDVRALLFD